MYLLLWITLFEKVSLHMCNISIVIKYSMELMISRIQLKKKIIKSETLQVHLYERLVVLMS